MAQFLKAKAPADAIAYTWAPDIADGDSLVSFTLSASGATIDAEAAIADEVEFYVSGGTAGQTATITASAVTAAGAELSEVLYLPIRARDIALGYTGSQIASFALRKVIGLSRAPRAAEQADALERLSDMLAEWSQQGADLGVRLPVQASDTLYVNDAFANAIKQNLIVRIADLYGEPVAPEVAMQAFRGVQLIKSSLLPDKRVSEFF